MISESQVLNNPKDFGLGHGTQVLSHLGLDEYIQRWRALELGPEIRTVNDNVQKLYQALKNENFVLDVWGGEPKVDHCDQQIYQVRVTVKYLHLVNMLNAFLKDQTEVLNVF